jgi:hypothetical protein
MSFNGMQEYPIRCSAATELQRHRFAKITKSTNAAAYAAAGNAADGVIDQTAVADGSAYLVNVRPLSNIDRTFLINTASAVTEGDELFASSDGKAVACTHDDIIDRGKQAAAPGAPTEGDKYILPAAGWSAAHENAIAVRGASAWAYTDVDAETNVGIVCFVVDEGRYVQWTGTAWTQVEVAAYANETGASGATIEAYVRHDVAVKPQGYKIKTAGKFVCATTAAAQAIADVNIAASDIVGSVIYGTQGGTLTIQNAAVAAGSLTVTASGAHVAGDTIHYTILAPFTIAD